jgi:hypothetical protein
VTRRTERSEREGRVGANPGRDPGDDDEHRQRLQPFGELVERGAELFVRAVEVVEEHERRSPRGSRARERDECASGAPAAEA